jgi:hypothetical protein
MNEPMTLEEAIAAAENKVSALCDGKEKWTMRIPADPDRDADLVIARALGMAKRAIDTITAELAAARQEFAEWVDASRKALDTHDALAARVRELEATLLDEHSRLAQEEAKPAAVGVVGTVRYGVLCMPKNYAPSMNSAVYSTHDAACRAWGHEPNMYRVVAIVDPDAIVPLASGVPHD